MKVEIRDEDTLLITPETVSELMFLRDLDKNGKLCIEKPRPFETNVEVLLIKKDKK